MPSNPLTRAAVVALALSALFILCWEIYLRRTGADTAFDDNAALWAYHRDRIYLPQDESTVFIGSSRIKFDLDQRVWKDLTGDEPVQLACVGSTPLPILNDLADDEKFSGKLIIDVTEGLFFSLAPPPSESPKAYIEYYHEITPSQRVSFALNRPLESTFAFLDKEFYSLNGLLEQLELKSREGVFMFPVFPRDFDRTRFNRRSEMQPAFLADTNQQNRMKKIWGILGGRSKAPPISGERLDSLLHTIKTATDKIKSRGGEIVFVRTPSSGVTWEREQKFFPREQYWNRILEVTQCPGIYFKDYPATADYICPEYSHLSTQDAVTYTEHLAQTLRNNVGWKFKK